VNKSWVNDGVCIIDLADGVVSGVVLAVTQITDFISANQLMLHCLH